ncbi:hypothetical protein NDU88_005119 [Pleurodeles waltl]|uniref:Uncharacterized protein n=1 Tax=Pleurodeles waltl TaxID=8319 RepID=A0AAV7RMD6_PLEWA|nr:hypothetical protein NDU88_005119 [Pleurodeles waltl]
MKGCFCEKVSVRVNGRHSAFNQGASVGVHCFLELPTSCSLFRAWIVVGTPLRRGTPKENGKPDIQRIVVGTPLRRGTPKENGKPDIQVSVLVFALIIIEGVGSEGMHSDSREDPLMKTVLITE